jgi:SAM-dependent methyltransferase
MTPEMIEKARENAKKGSFFNVEFRLGEIENLPVADESVDVVISNCVINLSANKERVFREVQRVLKPGGRVAISDMALLKELPEKIRQSAEAYVGCVAGAIHVDEYRRLVENSGLRDVRVTVKGTSSCVGAETKDPFGRAFVDQLDEGQSLQDYVASVYVEGRK